MATLLKILVFGPVSAHTVQSSPTDLLATVWEGSAVMGGSVYGIDSVEVVTQDSDGPAAIKNKVSAGIKAAAVSINAAFSAIQNNDMIFPDCSKGTGL